MNMSIDTGGAGQSPPAIGGDAALFLDVDGTLLEIAPTPSSVRIGADLRRLLGALLPALGGAVALVSGRAIADVDRLFRMPALPVAGLHGLERRDAAGHVRRYCDAASVAPLQRPIADFANARDGITVEDKGATIAVHYRRAPDMAQAVSAFLSQLIHGRDDFVLLRGKMVVEVKPAGIDKGCAIEQFMEAPPFSGRRPVFAGDDVTDEPGFAAVNARGGDSIWVGGDAATAARYRLADVASVHRWLAARIADGRIADGGAGESR